MEKLQAKIKLILDSIQDLRDLQEGEEDQGGKEELEREINQLYEDLDQAELKISQRRI